MKKSLLKRMWQELYPAGKLFNLSQILLFLNTSYEGLITWLYCNFSNIIQLIGPLLFSVFLLIQLL